MENQTRNLLIGATLLVVLVLIAGFVIYRERSKVDKFCDGDPNPAARAEGAGLYQLGVRTSENFCGSTASPAALAEAQGLMQTGWRAETMHARPAAGCAALNPEAIGEAQALQHANALSPGSPYYEKFDNLDTSENLEPDEFAARALARNKSAHASTLAQAAEIKNGPGQVSAHKARLDSMKEGFGGPDAVGFGWTPNAVDDAASPASCGWADAQSKAFGACVGQCTDGCQGTHCGEYCRDSCRQF